jgi:Sensors of blue-light using FAD
MQTDDLRELLDHARRSNAAKGITGALIYAEGIFLQILEGDKALLQDLMDKICRDVRHESVSVLRETEVPTANFANWKMAFVSATPKQIAKWVGVNAPDDDTASVSETSDEQNRTAQFAQDILSLLVADDTIEG